VGQGGGEGMNGEASDTLTERESERERERERLRDRESARALHTSTRALTFENLC
jgi:hypothetical protein